MHSGFTCSSSNDPSWQTSQWTLQPTGDGYYRLINRYYSADAINIESGFTCGSYQTSWWSADWVLQPAN